MRKYVLKLTILIIYLSSTFVMCSQELEENSTLFEMGKLITSTDPGTDTGGVIPLESGDAPGAPVDDWILPFVFISAIISVFVIRLNIGLYNVN